MPRSLFAIQDSIGPELQKLLHSLGQTYLVTASQTPPSQEDNASPLPASISLTIDDLAFLDKHGLLMLCSEAPLNKYLPAEHKQQHMAAVSLGIAATQTQTSSLEAVLNTLAQENLTPAIIFKGSALGPIEYQQSWHRPKSDHDLLIPVQAKAAFHDSLIEQGFTHIVSISGRYVSYQASYVKQTSGAAHIWIDLHWKISNRQMLASLFDYADMINSTRPLPLSSDPEKLNISALTPSRADCVVLAAQHVIGHHSVDTRLLWFFDLLVIICNCSNDELEQLVARCTELRVAGMVLAAIDYAESTFIPVLPDDIRQKLLELSAGPEATQILVTQPHTRARLIWWDLKSIDTWGGKFRFILENLFPDRAYMGARFGSKWLIISHLKRILGFPITPNQLK